MTINDNKLDKPKPKIQWKNLLSNFRQSEGIHEWLYKTHILNEKMRSVLRQLRIEGYKIRLSWIRKMTYQGCRVDHLPKYKKERKKIQQLGWSNVDVEFVLLRKKWQVGRTGRRTCLNKWDMRLCVDTRTRYTIVTNFKFRAHKCGGSVEHEKPMEES